MLIDTHCHLSYEDYDNLDEILNNKECTMIASGCNDKTNKEVLELVNKYDNVSIITHLNNLGRSQIQSLLALANKTIEKYNYSHSSEFIIDDLDFKNIKPKLESIPDESQTLSSDNPITSIISLLEIMKRDNLMVRF